MVFVYSGSIDDRGFGGLVKTIEPSDQQPFRPNTVMFLTTYGGHADQAYQIARLLQSLSAKFYLAFSKFKAHMKRLKPRTIDDLWKAAGTVCDLFKPEECMNFFAADGYAPQ